MFEPSQLLALGGIGAAVAVGWSHVKTAFSYVSNFVLVHDSFDSSTTTALFRKIRSEWKVVPGGPSVYRTSFLYLREGRDRLVPFRLPPQKAVYYRKGCLIFTSGSDNLSITYFRGSLNMERLVREALEDYTAYSSSLSTNTSRYRITPVTGREKGMFSGSSNSEQDSPARAIGSSATLNGSGYQETWLDTTIDKSFMFDSSEWMFDSTRDPFEHLYYNEEIDLYVQQAKRWMQMEKWYIDRLIPWRRGWLIEGPGGTGKTSLCKAVAYLLQIPVYQYNMSTLSSSELVREWEGMATPCMALFEDFDTVFNKREPITEHKSLSFDTVLNLISGINSKSGVFLMITTNDMSKIDPALGVARAGDDGTISTRPGRVDTVIHVGMMDARARHKLASRILRDWPESVEALVLQHTEVTPSQFQEVCIQYALKRMLASEQNVFSLDAQRQASL